MRGHHGIILAALYVADLDRSIAFYRDVIGMQVRLQFDEPTQKDVMIGFGPDPSQPSILLLSDKPAVPARKVQHGHGYDRMVFFISDLPALHDRLTKGGFSPTDIKEVHGSSMMMMVVDPDGYRLELIAAKPRPTR